MGFLFCFQAIALCGALCGTVEFGKLTLVDLTTLENPTLADEMNLGTNLMSQGLMMNWLWELTLMMLVDLTLDSKMSLLQEFEVNLMNGLILVVPVMNEQFWHSR